MYERASYLLILLMGCYSTSLEAKDPDYPKLEDIASQGYETQVELIEKIQQATAFAVDYYDFQEKRGHLDIVVLGQKMSYYYYNNPAQVLYIHDNICEVTSFANTPKDRKTPFYGWLNEDPVVVGPTALLRRPEKDLPTYIDKKTIRGISCNQFSLFVLDDRNNATIDYYFSDETWTTAFNKKTPVPVRIEINGMSSIESEKKEDFYEVNIIMDFIYFKPSVKDLSKFQPPIGIGCYGRNTGTSQKMPSIPKQFNFFAEFVDHLKEENSADLEVDSARVWYDQRMQVARVSVNSMQTSTSLMFDFRTGVIYKIVDRKSCTIEPLRDTLFEKVDSDSLVGYMKKPEEVLGLTGDFYYMGEREVRGIKCKTFESAKPNYFHRETKKRYKMLVITVFFATDKVKEAVEGEEVLNPPIFFLLTGYEGESLYKKTLETRTNIYAFSDTVGLDFFQSFRLEQCFPMSEQKSYFILGIQSTLDISKKIEDVNAMFLIEAKDQIITAANITEIRLPFIKAEYLPNGIYITGLMLDKPPALAQFWLESEGRYKLTKDMKLAKGVNDKESCALACVEMTGVTVTCRRFHMCGSKCYLNAAKMTDPSQSLDDIDLCSVYVRAESDSKNIQDGLTKALKNLETAVIKKKLQIPVPIDDEEEDVLTPSVISISDGPFNKEKKEYPYTLVFNGFQILSETDKTTTIEAPDAYTENECYRRCKDTTAMACVSFSYCFKASNKMCRLSSVLMDGRPENYPEIIANSACDVFSMMYLDYYDKLEGKLVLVPGEKQATNVVTVEECAQNCRNEKSFTCRGFEYCKTQKTCVLHSKHVLDLKAAETAVATAQCIHYSAKFSADYIDMGKIVIDDNSNVRNEITLEECARACSEEEVNCLSFNYCPSSDIGTTDSTCTLLSQSMVDKNVKTKKDTKCHHYAKRDNVYDWAKPKAQNPSTSSEGYTSGGLAGVIIGTLVFGIVVGALIFVAYSYIRTRKSGGEGMTVRFMKQGNL